ncbi:hypothetical protein DUI87_09442 [Hirundo rustica rustica]|uniref:Uncharacterized protein n=1 Tax=Hirundo rustica rustica TaxID=333673 RepID=A0A3M0KM64_HIRRU|nr:hypothetical protein DUI87_09442 [Hirundo rustica rustica]
MLSLSLPVVGWLVHQPNNYTAIRQVTNIKRETKDWLGGLSSNWGISVNHVTMPSEEDHEEEGLELEEVLEGTPEDEERNPDEEEHGLGYPTQHH